MLIEFFLGLGRLGGLAFVTLGALMIAAFAFLDPGIIALPALGGGLVLLGGMRLALRTSSERMTALIAEDESPPDHAPLTLAQARRLPLPFCACTDCAVRIEAEVMCPRCLKSTWCVRVDTEADRRLLIAALEPPEPPEATRR